MAKTILVTGGAGFIGSHLCERLVRDGHKVISLDNYFTGSKDNHVPGVEYREGHTKDVAALVPENVDLIYHLGEYARVEQSVLEPEVVHDLNTVGTAGVVNFWKARKCKLLYAGSSTKFSKGLANQHVPYILTKAANTDLVRAVGEENSLPYAITYFYNVYGPGERAGIYGTVIEAFRQMYLSGAPLSVTRPGTQKRNFTHVSDIIDGLVLVGERGEGDEFGLGNRREFSILEVANLFGTEIVFLPERAASRVESRLDTTKSEAIGWRATRTLESYIEEFLRAHTRGAAHEKKVLVFSTTFYPIVGPAEEALIKLIRKMPDVHFDIITSSFSRRREEFRCDNARVHHVGMGSSLDKYLLPFLGFKKACELHRNNRYLFAWSIMASYAAIAAVFLKRYAAVPLLITLADQSLEKLSPFTRMLLSLILSDADQVYGIHAAQESQAERLSKNALARTTLGGGDAFANQLRYAYAEQMIAARN